MHLFFKNREEIELFRSKLPGLSCPFCGRVGALVRHGYTYWSHSPTKYGIRGWRVRCKPAKQGCKKSWILRLGDTLPRRCFSASELWAFVQKILDARSLKNAWEQSGLPCSLDTAYRVYHRLSQCQSVLRTHLSARGPPPKVNAGVPLFQVLDHLKKAFGDVFPIELYQETLQRDFLATA